MILLFGKNSVDRNTFLGIFQMKKKSESWNIEFPFVLNDFFLESGWVWWQHQRQPSEWFCRDPQRSRGAHSPKTGGIWGWVAWIGWFNWPNGGFVRPRNRRNQPARVRCSHRDVRRLVRRRALQIKRWQGALWQPKLQLDWNHWKWRSRPGPVRGFRLQNGATGAESCGHCGGKFGKCEKGGGRCDGRNRTNPNFGKRSIW